MLTEMAFGSGPIGEDHPRREHLLLGRVKMKKSFVLTVVLALFLVACQPKTVVVEKTIVETQIVEVEKEVTKIVAETPVVETVEAEETPPSVTEGLPLPSLCDPDNPSPDSFLPALNFPRESVPNPYLDGGSALAVDYVNEKEQAFRITVSGQTEAPIEEYLDKLRICFEAARVSAPPPESTREVQLGEILIRAALDETGLTRKELSKLRDERDGTTLAVLIADIVGGNVDAVLGNAIERAAREVEAMIAEGDLTQEKGDELLASLEFVFLQALEEKDIPFLFEPVEGESGYTNVLIEDERTLVVDMEWLYPSEAPEEEWVVHYIIDPPINRFQNRYYQAKCQESAWARLRASAGRMSVYFWRYSPYQYIGTRTADVHGVSYPSGMYSSSSPQSRTYDLYTRGLEDGSSYTLYGNWWEGFGGACQ